MCRPSTNNTSILFCIPAKNLCWYPHLLAAISITNETGFLAFFRIVIRFKRVTHCGRDCYVKMIKHDATDYAAWANSDDRVSAIIPWHWDGCEGVDDCIKHIDEIGTAELPDVIDHWKGLVTRSQSDQRLRK